ncbi:MAG: sel1 repeat family protein [Olsenella sp.]|nr:sel1 repeat family protein [Olsenella sp.]
MTDWLGSGGGWSGGAPVFDWSWPSAAEGDSYDKSYGLPNVWVTQQVVEPTESATGRECVWCYSPEGDPDGEMALSFGARYYEEGMSCDVTYEHEKRVLCFRAAELLYLHASRKGNRFADLNLGYVYSYDRCEGSYWSRLHAPVETSEQDDETSGPDVNEPDDDGLGAATAARSTACEELDCDSHAYEHFRRAAESGIAEACYKLGDLLRDGRGCGADLAGAFEWFCRAYRLGRDESPVIWGSAALRLGRAFEEGEGCDQGFDEAEDWYERAVTGLGTAVRSGETWYRGALRQAEKGLARVRQELSGMY